MHSPKNILLAALVCLSASAGWGVPVAGRGDPLLNPLLSGGRQQSFSSMRMGELPPRVDVGVATIVNTGNPDGYSLRILDADGRFNTMGRFLTVEKSTSFQVEFAFGGVTAFAFNVGRLDHDMLVELYDDAMRLVESFRVRALSPGNSGTYIGAYSPTVPVHHAVFTLQETNDALYVDNLTVVSKQDLLPPPPYAPARAAALHNSFSQSAKVPDRSSNALMFLVAAASVLGLKRKLG